MNGLDMMSTAGGVVALGIISALVWEAIRRLAPIRGYIQRRLVRDWLGWGPAQQLSMLLDGDAVFNQTIPRMMAAIQSAISTAIEVPSRYAELYDSLTRGEPKDSELWRRYTERRAAKRTANPTLKTPRKTEARANPDALEQRRLRLVQFARRRTFGPEEEPALIARDRLERLVNRRLDSLQARCELWWAHVNHIATASVALILILSIIRATPSGAKDGITVMAKLIIEVATLLLAVLANETLRGLTERS
jgi:hypothetical protein